MLQLTSQHNEVSLCPALCCRDQVKEPASHNCETKNNQDKAKNKPTYQILYMQVSKSSKFLRNLQLIPQLQLVALNFMSC
jgi:hypothetical protein